MDGSKRIAEQFIHAVHRRMALIALIELVGLGISISSGLAILLIAVAVWQSMPVMPIMFICVLTGSIGGIAMAIHRWPTRRSAAMEADRQLRLDDLLLSVTSAPDSGDEFAMAMAAMADARCRNHVPSEVILRRLGVRSWGAIALTMCGAVVFAVIPFGSSRLQAVDANSSILSANTAESPIVNSSSTTATITRFNDPMSEGASNIPVSDDPPSDHTAVDAATASAREKGQNHGGGGGSSATAAMQGDDSLVGSPDSRISDANGTIAGGGAAAKTSFENHQTSTGTARAGADHLIPAWNGGGSTAGAEHSSSPVNMDRIPAQQRDLVRDFFGGK